MSKLIQKAVLNQMKNHSKANNLDERNQSAYRNNHRIVTALVRIFKDKLMDLDQRNIVFLTLLDLSAAFDTVDHTIILNRLENTYGYKETALQWFSSNLTERRQRVHIDGALSSERTLNLRVPQGAGLGDRAPLYCYYTRPVGNIIATFLLLYNLLADDSQLYKGLNPSKPENEITYIQQ